MTNEMMTCLLDGKTHSITSSGDVEAALLEQFPGKVLPLVAMIQRGHPSPAEYRNIGVAPACLNN